MPLLLVIIFLVIPILEIAVLIRVGEQIGAGPTILALLALSVAGAILAKAQGLAVWRRFRSSIERGEVPSTEIADGALILFGAALLLTPGFLTDFLGLALLLPPTRAGVRRSLTKAGGWLAVRRFPILIPLGAVHRRPRKVKARTVRTEPDLPDSDSLPDAQSFGPESGR